MRNIQPPNKDTEPKKRHLFRNTMITLVVIALAIILAGYLYIQHVFGLVTYIPDDTPAPTETSIVEPTADSAKEPTPKPTVRPSPLPDVAGVNHILILGEDISDPSNPYRGNTDVMMIGTLDRNQKEMKLASLMRDMKVYVPGHGHRKINSAYPSGGGSLALKTVNEAFCMNIKQYMVVDFYAVEDIIDEIGGVMINVKENEVMYLNSGVKHQNQMDPDGYSDEVVSAGEQLLNGRQAVGYARIRKTGNGDYERTDRQRYVANEVLKAVRQKDPFTILAVLPTFLKGVKTNIPQKELMSMALDSLQVAKGDIIQLRLPVAGAYRSLGAEGNWMLALDLDKNTKALHDFILK